MACKDHNMTKQRTCNFLWLAINLSMPIMKKLILINPVWKPEYSVLTRSIPLLLMLWSQVISNQGIDYVGLMDPWTSMGSYVQGKWISKVCASLVFRDDKKCKYILYVGPVNIFHRKCSGYYHQSAIWLWKLLLLDNSCISQGSMS